MEQLVWAIIIIIFIIFTALKNRARNRPDTVTDNTEYETSEKSDKIGRYMEELLGIEIPEDRHHIRKKREDLESLKKTVKPKQKPEEKIYQLESPLVDKYEKKSKSYSPESKKNIAKLPWGTLTNKDLQRAIVLSEIIGPPISKRKDHRLF